MKWQNFPRLTRRRFLTWSIAGGSFVVAGCRGAPASAGAPPVISVLVLAQSTVAVQQVLASHLTAAAREAGARLTLASEPAATLPTTIDRAIAAGQPPDVALVGTNGSAPLAGRGLLRDLRDTFDRVTGIDGVLFQPLATLASAGGFVDLAPHARPSIWAIPYLSAGGGWLLRKDVLAQKGINPPTTYDETFAALSKLTDPASDVFGWGAPLPLDEATDNLVQTIFIAYDATLFDPAGLRSVLNPDDGAAGLNALVGLYRADDGTPLANAGTADWSAAAAQSAFAAGKAAFTIDPGGMYGALLQASPELRGKITVSPPPAGPTGWYTASATSLWVVFDRSRVADLGAALVERVLQPGHYDEVTRAGLGSVVPPYDYLMRTPFWDDDPNFAVFAANARGDPARDFQYVTPGDPAPETLPVANVRGALVLAATARAVVAGNADPIAAATALRDTCVALAHQSYAFQAPPTPTPVPTWLQILRKAGFNQ